MRALFTFYAISFFLFKRLKRERVRGGASRAEEKTAASEEKRGVSEDDVLSKINDLAQKPAKILGFLDMRVPTWEKRGAGSPGLSIARFSAGRRRAARGQIAAADVAGRHRGASAGRARSS